MLPSSQSSLSNDPADPSPQSKSDRLSTKAKVSAEKEMSRQRNEFMRTVQGITYECMKAGTAMDSVILLAQDSLTLVSSRIDSTSWSWLAAQGKGSLAEVSRSEVMKYKSAFSEEEWKGVVKTWGIVEERARTTEEAEVAPLARALEEARRRRKVAAELAELSGEFHDRFESESIFDDVSEVETAMVQFLDRYNSLSDNSESHKNHRVFDDPSLCNMLRALLHPGRREEGDETSSMRQV